MITFLLMTCIIALALGLVSYVSSKRSNRTPKHQRLRCCRETSNMKARAGGSLSTFP